MKSMKLVRTFISKFIFLLFTVLFFILTLAFLIDEIRDGHAILYPLIGLWVFLAYILLPKIHRILTNFYLPDYFIGRTRSGDGFFSDPINIAIVGSEKDLHNIMKKAGWVKADKTSWRTSIKMTLAAIRRRSYKHAPVSPLYLFDRKQDFTYQQEMKNNPRSRHHVRFWKVPNDWYLPGGYQANWIGAATFDKHVGISLYTGQITHKISEHIDEERDHLVATLKKTKLIKDVTIVKHFTTAFRHRSGGGDRIRTDGSLPFVTLK